MNIGKFANIYEFGPFMKFAYVKYYIANKNVTFIHYCFTGYR